MSSASSYAYDVRENQRREALALQAASARAVELSKAFGNLESAAVQLSRAESIEIEIPYLTAPPLSGGRYAIETWITQAQGAVAALNTSVTAGKAKRVERQILSSLKKGVSGEVKSIDEIFDRLPSIDRSVEAEPETSSDWKAELVAKASDLAARAGGRVFDQDRSALTDLVAQIAGTESKGECEKRLDSLRYELQRALERGYERAQHQKEASGWLSKLRGLDGPEIPSLVAALEGVAEGNAPLSEELASRAERVVAQGLADSDRRYTAKVLSDAFQALGYSVGEGFATELADGGAELQNPDWDEYGVKLNLDRAQGLRLHLVRYTRGSSAESDRRDLAVGEEFCRAQLLLRRALHNQGVDLQLVDEHKPGEMPLMLAPGRQAHRSVPIEKAVTPPKAMRRPGAK